MAWSPKQRELCTTKGDPRTIQIGSNKGKGYGLRQDGVGRPCGSLSQAGFEEMIPQVFLNATPSALRPCRLQLNRLPT